MRRGADRDAALLHGLQKSGLGLGRGPIDLVRQQDIREDRSFLEGEMLFAGITLVDDVTAHDITGHEVGRELDARKSQMQYVGHCRYDLGLADSRNTLQEHMSLGKQADQRPVDDLIIAHDDSGDLFFDPLKLLGELADLTVD